MAYAVKEIFLTLQGEGAQAGRRAVFCRFAGCNLWTGREVDRAKAVCKFCDTDIVCTDGTLAVPRSIDWICISPKAGSELVQLSGDELKLVWPQPGSDVEQLATLDFEHRLVQPLDDPNAADNVQRCIDLVMSDPRWRLSLQAHKSLGLR